MEYGVQTHNKFAFLDEDVSDPEEILVKAEEEKKKAAAAAQLKRAGKTAAATKTLATKETAVKPAVVEKKDGGIDQQQKSSVKFSNDRVVNGRPNREFRGDQGANRGGGPRQRRPQNFQRDGTDSFAEREKRLPNGRPPRNESGGQGGREAGGGGDWTNDEQQQPQRRGPPRTGGGGGGRRGGGPRSGDRNFRGGDSNRTRSTDKEEHKEEDKTNRPVDENKSMDGFAQDEKTDTEHKENFENVENSAVDDEKKDEAVAEEQAPRGKTYEEWKAELNQKAVDSVQFKTRQAGEGADQKIYQKLVPIKKVDKEKKGEDALDEAAQHKEKREKALPVDLAFTDKRSTFSRSGYERGGEGGGRPFAGGERSYGGGDRSYGGGGDRSYGGGGGGDRSYGGGGDRQNQGGRGPGQRGGGGGYRNNFGGGGGGGPGTSRRPHGKQDEFTLENDQFPALGAAH